MKVLTTQRLFLKPITMEHCTERYLSWLNDYEVCKYLETKPPYTMEKLRVFIESIVSQDILMWAIHTKETDIHIGNIKIDPITGDKQGEYGILIGDTTQWGKGFAQEVSQAVIDYCFHTLSLKKITLGVIAENKSAIKLYKKLGFEVEKELYNQKSSDGTICNILRMYLLNKVI